MIFEGLPGVLGNKGTLAKCPMEQGNMSLFLGNRGTKLYKLEDENIVSKFITRGTNTENVREHGNIGQFSKGTRTPQGDPHFSQVAFRNGGTFPLTSASVTSYDVNSELVNLSF